MMHLRIVGIVCALFGIVALFEIRPAPRSVHAISASVPIPASSSITSVVTGSGPQLRALPIDGLRAADLHDSFSDGRGLSKHEAIDIMEPRGTPVHAVVDGTLARLFWSRAGGHTVYQFDNNRVYCYYYAHLDHYAPGVQEGQRVSAGDVIAYVGSTGNASASAPHLHFTIFELEPEKRWWKGTVINPYPILLRRVTEQR